MATLRTPRLVLRPPLLSDAARLEALIADKRVLDGLLNVPDPYPPGGAVEWIERDDGEHRFVITRAELLIGGIALRVDARHRRGEIGYWLGVAYWHQGYATEAARAVIRHAFEALLLHKVTACCFPRNERSARVLENCGMQREGLLREHGYRGGRFEDEIAYGLLRQDWPLS